MRAVFNLSHPIFLIFWKNNTQFNDKRTALKKVSNMRLASLNAKHRDPCPKLQCHFYSNFCSQNKEIKFYKTYLK